MATQIAHFPNAWSDERQTGVQISRVYGDGFLYLEGDTWSWIELNRSYCSSVHSLELNLVRYDVEKIGDSITELTKLTHLSICDSVILKCVTNVTRLHNLQGLKIINCKNLEGLPENLGELQNLTLIQLSSCSAIKYLPNSIAELSMLSTLKLEHCKSLTSLPAVINVVELKLYKCCRIQSFPTGLTDLERLNLTLCSLSEDCFSSFLDAKRLQHLNISVCGLHPVQEIPANLNEFISLETLSINSHNIKKLPSFARLRILRRLCLYLSIEEFPINMDELPQLLLLDIHLCYNIKYLPSNLTYLLNLQFLLLPHSFILETLPYHLNDSLIISVHERHIRKTWKVIKQEMGPLLIQASPLMVKSVTEAPENLSPVYASFYLLKEDPFTHFMSLPNFVQILELKLQKAEAEIGDIIAALPNLTHLYILQGKCLRCLPSTITHLSLSGCNLDHLSHSLGNLSNLRSLDLCLHEKMMSAALDILFCLELLTLRKCEHCSLPENLPRLYETMAKLSNLNTLELIGCSKVSLPENSNVIKLKLVNCYVESLPTSLCHLEIIHGIEYCWEDCCGNFDMCLKEFVKLRTLSLTCYKIKCLPSIAGPQFLQTLLFKDCINLRELMPNFYELVELCTLDVSGTRIKSLPECITNLPKLQRLVLPKCFQQQNLAPPDLRNKSIVNIEFDSMDEIYYKYMGHYNYRYESSTKTSEQNNETSSRDNEVTPGSVMGLGMVRRELGEDNIINVQTLLLPNPPNATQGLGDFHTSHHASSCSQSQETENLFLGVCDSTIVADMITELSSDFPATNFGDDRQKSTINLGNEESTITSSHQLISSSFVHYGNNHDDVVDSHNNSSHGAHKKRNRRKKEITCKEIQSLRDEHMTLIEAAMKLGVSRSTMKRRCKEHRLSEWSSSREKNRNYTKRRKLNTEVPSGGEASEPNLVECNNPDGSEYAYKGSDLDQHNFSNQIALECEFIDNSTANTTTESIRRFNVETQSVPECPVGTNIHPLLGTVQDSSSSSSFYIKATYKDDIVRFKWSSTDCLKELKEAMVENLMIESGSFKLKYQDEEEDWVLINTNEHLKIALSLMKNEILRLKVTDL